MDGIKVKNLQTKDGLNTVDISLYGEIGDGWSESDLYSVSQKIAGADKVTVRINSFGGSSADGIGIHNLLEGSKAEVEIVIMGVAMSAAAIIAMAGKCYAYENSILMFHSAWVPTVGNAASLQKDADALKLFDNAAAKILAAKVGKDEATMLELYFDGEDHFLSAKEAKELGFVDVILDGDSDELMSGSFVKSEWYRKVRSAGLIKGEPEETRKDESKEPAIESPQDTPVVQQNNLTKGVVQMSDEVKKSDAKPAVDVEAQIKSIRDAETNRIERINKMADAYGAHDLGRQYISKGASTDEFMDALAVHQKARNEEIKKSNPTLLDMEPKQVKRYSLMKAIRSSLSGDWRGAEFERECSNQISDDLGREARGFFIPLEIQTRGFAPRSGMTVGTDSAGGYLVGTDHMAGSFIEFLRANPIAMQAGAVMLDGLVGDIEIPKQNSAASFYWLSEDGTVTDSSLLMGSVTMSPKTVAGSIPISRRLMKQSSPSVEALVQQDLALGAALAIDDVALEGTGVGGKPLGMTGVTGINTQSVSSAGSPTWAEIVGFESNVATDNALAGNLAYITTPAVFGALRTTSKDTGSGQFLADDAGRVAGYNVYRSTQVATNGIYFGNWSDLVIGLWGVLDVMVDDRANASAGGLVIRVFQDIDVAVRHPESFCINA